MLKPMDIHNVEFKRAFKGYHPEEVDNYLASIVSKYETVYQENQSLQAELQKARGDLQKQVQQEQDVLDLISLTKQTVDEIKNLTKEEAASLIRSAEAEADGLISDAHLQAKRIVADAQLRLAEVQRAEKQLKEKIRFTMESIWNMLSSEGSHDLVSTRPYGEVAAKAEELENEDS